MLQNHQNKKENNTIILIYLYSYIGDVFVTNSVSRFEKTKCPKTNWAATKKKAWLETAGHNLSSS